MKNNFVLFSQIKASLQGKYSPLDPAPTKLKICFSVFILHLCFIPLFLYLNVIELAYFNIFSAALWWWAVIESAKGYYLKSTLIGSIEVIAHAVFATFLLGTETGFHLYIWPLLSWLSYSFATNRVFTTSITSASICILISFYLIDELLQISPAYSFDGSITLTMFVVNLCFATLLLVFSTYSVRKSVDEQKCQLELMATRDQLTKLYNRHYFYDFIEKYRHRAIRDKEPYCLAIADIDFFKKINDVYGHSFGDTILILVAEYLEKNLRSNDVIARWGGEEFLFVLVNCDISEANKRVEQLRLGLAKEISLDQKKQEINEITMSFGVVQSDNDKTIDELISKADELLFEAKRAGRNRVVTEIVFAM